MIPEFHRYLIDAFDLRQIGDYSELGTVTKTQSELQLVHAREILDWAEKTL